MECHYCDREAEITVEKEDIQVGVCERHFQEQMEELAEADVLGGVEEELDIDSVE